MTIPVGPGSRIFSGRTGPPFDLSTDPDCPTFLEVRLSVLRTQDQDEGDG